ncbi:proprotein convertase P-domain-containing protein [Parasphingorhabdus sp.]|uniref:proprotein convertase P-domain-containing protein n=1 Tax=Parasphingorhabdus sp. TaxID=2709688 RepID=UPI0032651D66
MTFGKSIGGQGRLTFHTFVWALLCLCSIALFPAGKAEAQTVTNYSYTGATPVAIPDNQCPTTMDFNITVGGPSYVVGDVDLGILMDHTYRRDLEITLRSPTGTTVTLMDFVGGGANNLNVRFDDEATGGNITTHTAFDPLTPVYNSTKIPQNSLSAFDGEQSAGIWTLSICDQQGIDTGSFRGADLYITEPQPFADLSLTKTFGVDSSNTAIYTISVTNAASSPLTASGVQISDSLPAGLLFQSAAGDGTYDSGTGIWTVGTAIAPGQTYTLEISVIVTATFGTITNVAEIISSSAFDFDSTPNNGNTNEDDYAAVSFNAALRLPGYAPPLTSICPIGNQVKHSWAAPTSWPSGSLDEDYTVTGLGTIEFDVTAPANGFLNGTPQISTAVTGGEPAGTRSLNLFMNNSSAAEFSETVLTLPTAVPGLQFTIFDIDFTNNRFTDQVTITGEFNNTTVFPTLSNNVANYVSGNSIIGDGASINSAAFGNAIVTFTSPVDTITIRHDNYDPTTPNNPREQTISIHDITFCQPSTELSVTKISTIVSDPINGTTNAKRIPGGIVQYCILISNSAGASADSIVATDNLVGPFTYNPGTMRTGNNCGTATTVEDDNAAGGDESDPYGASFAGSTITVTADTLAPSTAFALTFQVTID